MAKTVTKYSIFLASPSDLDEERNAIEDVIKELNISYGLKQNITIELLKWETHSAPGISESHPQSLINRDIGNEYDIFIGLLWKKFGTPTENANSGTEEEYKNAIELYNSNKNSIQILFYFKNAVPKSLTEINASELLKIEQFKNSIKSDNLLFWDFDSCDSLKNYLRMHIPRRIDYLINNSKNQQANDVSENIESNIIDHNDFGLLDYREMFDNSMSDSTNSIKNIGKDTKWVGEEITKKSQEIKRISKLPNPNMNILTNAFKRTAKLLNDYTNRIEIETPIFYSSFEDAIQAGINLLNLIDDFNNADTIQNLEETKASIIMMRTSIPDALDGMSKFYQSIKSLPRIQKDLTIAKNKLLIQLEDLMNKLSRTQDLSEEFSNELGNKIDKLKLELEN